MVLIFPDLVCGIEYEYMSLTLYVPFFKITTNYYCEGNQGH